MKIKNDLRSFEIWTLIALVLFVVTIACGIYIEMVGQGKF